VEVRLDAEGRQREVKLMQSSGFASLDRAALEAVAQWKFQPEVQAGRALPSRVRIPIDFALHTRR
jgi:protein TonB